MRSRAGATRTSWEARDESHCADCGEVFSVSDLECDREGREGSDICEDCHEDWLEDQEDDEEEVA